MASMLVSGKVEAVEDVREKELEVLDLAGGLEGELHDVLVRVRGGEVEHEEDVGPARLDVVPLHVDHVGHAAHHHVPHRAALVVLHDVLEGAEEIFLEMKVGQLSLLDELLCQLSEGIYGEEGDILGLAAADQIEMFPEHLPERF